MKTAVRKNRRYAVRRNRATGRWIMFWHDGACYRIMGSASTQPYAIEAIFE